MRPVLVPPTLHTPADAAALPMCREIIEKAGVGLAVMDLDGSLREANNAFCETTGHSRDELLSPGFSVRSFLLPDEAPGHEEGLRALRRGDEQGYRKTMQIIRGDGTLVWVDWVVNLLRSGTGGPQVLLTTIDVTEQKRVQDAFRDMSFRDPLTKLPNRRLLIDRLQTALARARRDRCGVALLFIDLDNFKPVNDNFGHNMGDLLLKVLARRLLACVRPYDTAARFGGDEFVVLLPDVAQRDGVDRVAERVLASFSEPFVIDDGRRIDISASIGIAIYPDNAHSERELLHAADEAMYLAKKAGRNRIARAERSYGTGTVEVIADEESAPGLIRLRWDSAYASGNVFIDTEHSELFRQSNQLLDLALHRDADRASLIASLQRLLQSIGAHFEHEERLLSEWRFPDADGHALKHRSLLEHAQQVVYALSEQANHIGDLLRFLVVDVIQGHMLVEDSKYFELAKRASTR